MITINSRSFDGALKKTWKAELIDDSNGIIAVKGTFDRTIEHPHMNVIRRGTLSYEYFWLDRWFNVFRFHEPDGTFRNYYCNVCMPPSWHEDVLDYVDLDIDVIVDAAGRLTILDEDEFRENAARFGYPAEVRTRAEDAVGEIMQLIGRREFPFEDLGSLQQS